MDYAKANEMTIEDLIKLVEAHQPQSNRHYFIEFSKFGVTLTTGEVERNRWGTTKRDIVARGLESCIRYILHDFEIEYAVLTPLQQERKEKVIGKRKLSDTQLEAIRKAELNSNYNYSAGSANWGTYQALQNRGIIGEYESGEKFSGNLFYMTDDGFAYWEGLQNG